MKTEQDNPFLTRIIHEPQLVENDNFGVVTDIDPIVPNHYLFYLKQQLPSIADCDFAAAADFLENQFLPIAEGPYAYLERGRASFCTSMDGVQHGHGHLVPAFGENLSGLFPYGEELCFPSLKEAYAACDQTGQYLLWGNLGEQFYLIRHVEQMPKRTIRNTVREYSSH